MKPKLILYSIILIALFLRVWMVDVIPFGFTPDEASFGYDAYSLLKTGKDQWGKSFPLVLESFGDFKMPLYSYFAMPFVFLFDLSKFSVRFLNVLIGTGAVYATYLLVFELFNNFKNRSQSIDPKWLALLASFLLAINPWHIMMSRGAFEANLTTFLMPVAVYFFFKGIKKQSYLVLSSLFFGLNLFSYHSARLVTPLILGLLIVVFRKEFYSGNLDLSMFKKFKLPIVVFSIFLIASVYTLTQGSGTRAKDITIFAGSLEEASQDRFSAIYQGLSIQTARLFHNKFQVLADRFLANYFQYTSINFLFINGPAEATYGMIPGRGVLYWFELLFLVSFVYALFNYKDKKALVFILLWILIAPIPAALTTGKGFAANRALVMQPALTIASAVGAYVLFGSVKDFFGRMLTKIVLAGYSFICLLLFISFLEEYFVLSPFKYSKDMLYGNLEVSDWLSKNADDKNVVVSKKLSEPHIYIAFAYQWDPKGYQHNSQNWKVYRERNLLFVDQLEEYSLEQFTFKSIDYSKSQNIKDTLLVGKPEEFPSEVSSKVRYLYPNGETAVMVVQPFNEAYATTSF